MVQDQPHFGRGARAGTAVRPDRAVGDDEEPVGRDYRVGTAKAAVEQKLGQAGAAFEMMAGGIGGRTVLVEQGQRRGQIVRVQCRRVRRDGHRRIPHLRYSR